MQNLYWELFWKLCFFVIHFLYWHLSQLWGFGLWRHFKVLLSRIYIHFFIILLTQYLKLLLILLEGNMKIIFIRKLINKFKFLDLKMLNIMFVDLSWSNRWHSRISCPSSFFIFVFSFELKKPINNLIGFCFKVFIEMLLYFLLQFFITAV